MEFVTMVLFGIIIYYFYAKATENPEVKRQRIELSDKNAKEDLMLRRGLGCYWVIQFPSGNFLGKQVKQGVETYGGETDSEIFAYKFQKLSEAVRAKRENPSSKIMESNY